MFIFQQSLLLVLYKLIRIMYTQHHVTLHSKIQIRIPESLWT